MAKTATGNRIRQGCVMIDESRTAHPRTEQGARVDAPTVSEGGVEIVLPGDYRLPCEASRALVQTIMAVRGRMLGSERGVA